MTKMMQSQPKDREKGKNQPKKRSEGEIQLLNQAKQLLMEKNHMTEEAAHRYMQKCSMESGTNIVETAQMVLCLDGFSQGG